MTAVLRTHRVERVEVLTLDRPERLNALDRELLRRLAEAVAAARVDEAVGCLIVTGAGDRAFSAGADITAFADLTALEAEELMRYGQEVFAQLEACPKPVIAAVNGYALGGGLELALACDFRIARAGARLGQPEITLANLPGWGATQRLPRIVGEAAAKDLIFTGRLVDAAEALALRLVNRVAAGSALEAAVELGSELSERAPSALALAKQAIHASRIAGEAGYAVERQGVGLCFTTQAQHEAVRAFTSRKSTRRGAPAGKRSS